MLNDDLRVIFGTTERLFASCFKKKENYIIEENGRITVKYSVKLKSEEFAKETVIHLISEEISEAAMKKVVARKVEL